MNTTHLDIRTPDGVADSTLHLPPGKERHPGVLLITDGLGVRPAIQELAARFAAAGYAVLVPNVFYPAGKFKPFDPVTVWTDEPERQRLMSTLFSIPTPTFVRDVGVYIDTLLGQPGVKAGPIGMVGYCFGGGLTFRSAAAYPERIAAGAAIHGGRLVEDKPDSPHLGAPKVKAQLYFACADEDRSLTPENRAALSQALTAAGVRFELELYEAKRHGFAVTDTPSYDQEARERQFTKVLGLFAKALH